MQGELYTVKDRKGQEYCLSPTNEEVITNIVKELVNSHSMNITFQAIPSDYPFMVYQTSQKFRDEKRIKAGVLRSKEFLMMDLYLYFISFILDILSIKHLKQQMKHSIQ